MLSVAKDIIFSLHARGSVEFEGADWERTFAKAIGAQWKPSNVGLDDIVLGNCCWGAKTIKAQKPFSQHAVRLISGRNSLDYSYGDADVRKLEPNEVGEKVLSIWNERVSAVRRIHAHVRTVVLLKGPRLLSGAIFELNTERVEPELIHWAWNKNKNLEGHGQDGSHRFTWQPHGAQFTIIEKVPSSRAKFSVTAPPDLDDEGRMALLQRIGYDDSWIRIE